MDTVDNNVNNNKNKEEKRCPFCGESIRAIAIKCRHCSSSLNSDELLLSFKRKANQRLNKQISYKAVIVWVLLILFIGGLGFGITRYINIQREQKAAAILAEQERKRVEIEEQERQRELEEHKAYLEQYKELLLFARDELIYTRDICADILAAYQNSRNSYYTGIWTNIAGRLGMTSPHQLVAATKNEKKEEGAFQELYYAYERVQSVLRDLNPPPYEYDRAYNILCELYSVVSKLIMLSENPNTSDQYFEEANYNLEEFNLKISEIDILIY